MLQVSQSSYLSLPQDPGVYQFLDENGTVLYVGKAKNLKKRVASYFTKSDLGEKTRILVSKISKIQYTIVTSEVESLLLEASYIKKYSPQYNIRMTDGKAYPLIRITVKDDYPKVLIARRPEDKNSVYFGPYPNTSAMRLVLKTARRIFPYESVVNHPKRFCLYHHLGLCPCAEAIGTDEEKRIYRKTIKLLCVFLDGNVQNVVKDLERERELYSTTEDFEKASYMQRKLDAIKLITSPFHQPFEYEENPNLREDLREKELDELQTILNNSGLSVPKIQRIECYDISNTQGTNATGSMVVFTNGEKDAKWYRRFKISPENVGPNDFSMMYEVITRRLKHTEWPYPQVLIVDGGKGQITMAAKAMEDNGVTIPLVGLAKREEIIITKDFTEIRLSKSSRVLQLMMRIRDEAHRFAITYHKKLRSKATFL